MLAIDIASPTAAPESPHFPVDPSLLLRTEWQCLAVYYPLAILATLLIWRHEGISRKMSSLKHRLIVAALLSLVFTPGEVSDFFFFTIPGPAGAGLAMLFVGLLVAAISDPIHFIRVLFTTPFVGMFFLYFILPVLLVFAIAYALLSFYVRRHREVTSHA